MQTIESIDSNSIGRGGGRVASPAYRQSLALSEDFVGLEEGVKRYDLLLLVKRVGKAAGFSPRMIQLLDYYMAYTRDVDWEEGARPVVYQSLARTALDLGVSERQIQKLESRLFEAGAITWRDSGNHRRFGQRDVETGRILFAFGVDLAPLAYLRAELEDKLHQKRLYDQAWLETKRQISWYRRQIRSTLLECEREEGACAPSVQTFEQRLEEIAVQIRTHFDLEALRALLARHKSLHSELIDAMGVVGGFRNEQPAQASNMAERTRKSSSTNDSSFVHYKSTTQPSTDKSVQRKKGFQESVSGPPERPTGPSGNEDFGEAGSRTFSSREERILATGLQHIELGNVLQAASDRFRAYLPIAPDSVSWPDVTDAAHRLRVDLHISQQSWAEACELLGRSGAAVCVLLTDRAAHRVDEPIGRPAAYFRSLINRASTGELRLHRSVFGLVRRYETPEQH